jgi:co-chaperonin GroES (HSP10)
MMMLLQPRNTLVLVQLKKKPEEKRGQIIVKTDSEMFSEADVLAVGPDCVSAAGGQAGTHDLKVGQRVLVQFQTLTKDGHGMVRGRKEQGLKLEENITGGRKDLYLFEQTALMAILAEPETLTTETQ